MWCRCTGSELWTHSGWWVGGRRQRRKMVLYYTWGNYLRRWQRRHILQGFVFRCLILRGGTMGKKTPNLTKRWRRNLILKYSEPQRQICVIKIKSFEKESLSSTGRCQNHNFDRVLSVINMGQHTASTHRALRMFMYRRTCGYKLDIFNAAATGLIFIKYNLT